MNSLFIPEGYKPHLDVYDTQKAISFIKRTFQERFAQALRLKRVSAPLFVTAASGLNDNLSGKERPVTFDVPAVGESVQVVHSLAKWKRMALKEYRFYVGNGLYTDMNAIRRDEELDNIPLKSGSLFPCCSPFPSSEEAGASPEVSPGASSSAQAARQSSINSARKSAMPLQKCFIFLSSLSRTFIF